MLRSAMEGARRCASGWAFSLVCAVLGVLFYGGSSQAALTIAVPAILSADVTSITAWAAGMVTIGVTAVFIIANASVVVRFLKWVVFSMFRVAH